MAVSREVRPDVSCRVGLSTPSPYDGVGVLGEAAFPAARNAHLRLGLRYGRSAGLSEYGGSVGFDYRWVSVRR